jgi:hypothetical protein
MTPIRVRGAWLVDELIVSCSIVRASPLVARFDVVDVCDPLSVGSILTPIIVGTPTSVSAIGLITSVVSSIVASVIPSIAGTIIIPAPFRGTLTVAPTIVTPICALSVVHAGVLLRHLVKLLHRFHLFSMECLTQFVELPEAVDEGCDHLSFGNVWDGNPCF